MNVINLPSAGGDTFTITGKGAVIKNPEWRGPVSFRARANKSAAPVVTITIHGIHADSDKISAKTTLGTLSVSGPADVDEFTAMAIPFAYLVAQCESISGASASAIITMGAL